MEATAVLAVIRAARPAFRDRADRVAFALHALLLVRGARLIAIGQAAEAEPPAGALAAEECGHDGWNAAEGTWAFRYVLGGSVVTFKALLMGDRFLADVARGTDGKAASVDVSVSEHTTGEADAAAAYARLGDLLSAFGAAVDRALGPGAAPPQASAQQQQQRRPEQPRPDLRDDDADISGRYGGAPARPPPGGGFGVGGSDLYPPGLPRLPAGPPLGGIVDPGGGMMIGPGHPGWGLEPPVRMPPGVPPGARFDPYGPPDVPGFEPGRFGGGRGGGGGGFGGVGIPGPGRGMPGGLPLPGGGARPPVHPDVMQPGLGDDEIGGGGMYG